jgi:hypothetical protein
MDERSSVLGAFLAATHLVVPDEVPALVQQHAERLGARTAVVFLVDLDQRWLAPLIAPGAPALEELAIDGTLAGRCFRTLDVVEAASPEGTSQWVPMLDGTERVGVLHLTFGTEGPAPEGDVTAFATLVGEIVMSKGAYGDFFEFARRRQPLTIGSELLWQLLPPLTFATEAIAIAAGFIPTERLGGDAFDYGVDRRHAQVAIFDAVGHDLRAGLLATTAVAAFRNARRSRLALAAISGHIGRAISDHFGDDDFVTGVVASLDIDTGILSWCVAGHPSPLLLRHGRVVKHLDGGRGQPFGVGPCSEVLTEPLEAGDRVLLYTDGVIEARDHQGRFFEIGTLVDLVSRTAAGDPPPETMRLLMHAIEEHNHGALRDDATVVMIEWHGPGSRQLHI